MPIKTNLTQQTLGNNRNIEAIWLINLNGLDQKDGLMILIIHGTNGGTGKKNKTKIVGRIQTRRYFYSPWKGKNIMLPNLCFERRGVGNHLSFPGLVSTTPTFERIPSKIRSSL